MARFVSVKYLIFAWDLAPVRIIGSVRYSRVSKARVDICSFVLLQIMKYDLLLKTDKW